MIGSLEPQHYQTADGGGGRPVASQALHLSVRLTPETYYYLLGI